MVAYCHIGYLSLKFSDYCKITNFTCFGYYCDKTQCLILENLRTIWGGLIGYCLFRIVDIPKSENGCKFVMSDVV
jgi:hypothetical protein